MCNCKIFFISKFILIAFIVIIISSCKTTMPRCYEPLMKNLIIRWGERITKTGEIKGYQLSSKAMLYSYNQKANINGINLEEISYIKGDDYCKVLDMIRFILLKKQVINEPGDTVRFIEYINSYDRTDIRGVWNQKFKTNTSEGHRDIYDTLQSLLPAIK